MSEQSVKIVENEVTVTKGRLTNATSTVSTSNPEGKATSAIFIRKDFVGSPDKTKRLVQTPDKAS